MNDVTDLEDARMAKALGLPVGSVTVAVCDDDAWKKFPLALPAGLARAAGNLGLKRPTDWPGKAASGDPFEEVSLACENLGAALDLIRTARVRMPIDAPSYQHLALTLETWATSLEAVMGMIHATANQAYRFAKLDYEQSAMRDHP
jgi:hypothetical protein